jgi:endonuclease G
LDIERDYTTNTWLAEDETLESGGRDGDDYEDLRSRGYDRGHLAPKASFKGTRHAWQVNLLSNIVPQVRDLNQGPWARLEDSVRDVIRRGQTVFVMTGPLYEQDMPRLPECEEHHVVPSGFWKIVATVDDGGDLIDVAAFILDQETPRNADFANFAVDVDEVEERSGLDFLWELNDAAERALESWVDTGWLGG